MAREKVVAVPIEVGQVWHSFMYSITRVVTRVEGGMAYLESIRVGQDDRGEAVLTKKGTVSQSAPRINYGLFSATQADFYKDYSLVAENWQGGRVNIPSPDFRDIVYGEDKQGTTATVTCPKCRAKVVGREIKQQSYTHAEYARHYLACGK